MWFASNSDSASERDHITLIYNHVLWVQVRWKPPRLTQHTLQVSTKRDLWYYVLLSTQSCIKLLLFHKLLPPTFIGSDLGDQASKWCTCNSNFWHSCPICCIEIDAIQDQNLEHLGSGKVWRKLEYKFEYARKLCRRAEMTTLYETWTCSRHHSHVSF